MKQTLFILLTASLFLLAACGASTSTPQPSTVPIAPPIPTQAPGEPTTTLGKITFEKIGSKGATVFLTLVSPTPVSEEELANQLKEDWQNNLFNGNMILVKVFDNKEAPIRWLELWDRLPSMPDEERAEEMAQILPHEIAQYWKSITTGLHQVDFLSMDAKATIIRTITF